MKKRVTLTTKISTTPVHACYSSSSINIKRDGPVRQLCVVLQRDFKAACTEGASAVLIAFRVPKKII
jgi:hypothetical protein